MINSFGFVSRVLWLAVCLVLAGCAGPGPLAAGSKGNLAVRTGGERLITPQEALRQIVAGASAKSEVMTALGEGIVVRFDSGYEVWIYRWQGSDQTVRGSAELVVLFDPSGLATKVRLRPGYAEQKR